MKFRSLRNTVTHFMISFWDFIISLVKQGRQSSFPHLSPFQPLPLSHLYPSFVSIPPMLTCILLHQSFYNFEAEADSKGGNQNDITLLQSPVENPPV